MPPRTRTLIEDTRKIRIQSLYNSGKIRVRQTTSSHLLGRDGPQFTAFLGSNSYGWLQIGTQKWALESRRMQRFRGWPKGVSRSPENQRNIALGWAKRRELASSLTFMKEQVTGELVDQLDNYLHEAFSELEQRLPDANNRGLHPFASSSGTKCPNLLLFESQRG